MDKKLFNNQIHLFVPIILLLFYTALPYRYKMCDIIRYAEAIESSEIKANIIWHPSHILYGPLGYIIYSGLEKIGKTFSPFQIYSTLGIISAAFSTLLMGLLMHHFGSSSKMISLSYFYG